MTNETQETSTAPKSDPEASTPEAATPEASPPEKSATARKKITLLPPDLVNQIAAGEVIERPASVVKELVENSLDAGAKRLTIELEDGGKTLVRIIDDGGGIAAEELPLAIQNHATSKLRALPDLFEIATLGFRGEALASISSVSQLRIQSRPKNETGAEIRVDGGKISPVKACALPGGTRIEVRNLFFNVPARRKFLKSDRSEITAVTQQLTRLALSRPEVHIIFKHNGKSVLNVPPADEPRERIARLTTQVIAEEIIAIGPRKSHKVDMELRGYVSPFNITRADTRGQHFFINGRAIRDPLLISAVKDSYLHLLPPRRHPYVFLWLDVDPGDVDVNVHPTKAEVRFRYSSDVYALIVSTIKAALSELSEPPPLLGANKTVSSPENIGRIPTRPAQGEIFNFQARATQQAMNLSGPVDRATSSSYSSSYTAPTDSYSGSYSGNSSFDSGPSFKAIRNLDSDSETYEAAPNQSTTNDCEPGSHPENQQAETNSQPSTPSYSASNHNKELRYGRFVQLHNSFIVEETAEGIKIVDQHALHERILYNQIVKRLSNGRLETQRMLFPITEQIDVSMAVIYAEIEPILRELGFDIELREDKTLAISSIPRFVKPEKALQIVMDLLGEKHPSFVNDEVEALDKETLNCKAFQTQEGLTMLHKLASSLACKAAIKFGMPLTHDEISALLEARQGIERAYCCPHGRPTTLSLSMSELRRRFGRPG